MRVPALLLALLLLAMPVALAQQNNTTENQTSNEQASGSNDTAEDGSEDDTNVTLPDRSGHIPWAGLAVGLIIFAASVVVSRVTYHGRD